MRLVPERRKLGIFTYNFLFQPPNVLEKTLTRQPQKIKPKLRILKIQLFYLLVGRSQHRTIFGTFDRLRAPVIRREEPEIAKHLASWDFDVHFAKAISTTHAVIHPFSHVSFPQDDFPLAEPAVGHEGLQPVNRRFTVRSRGLNVLN